MPRPATTPAAPAPAPPPPDVPPELLDFVEPYRPLGRRHHVGIGVLTLVTVVTVAWMMTVRPGAQRLPGPASAPDAARCAPGQTRDCVGGAVMVLPAAPVADPSATSHSPPPRAQGTPPAGR
jgi:hypothetical protein